MNKYPCLLLMVLLLGGVSALSQAQDNSIKHATLKGWTDNVQRVIYHKEGQVGDRFYQHGLFRFFTREMDYEYDMDMFTIHPTLTGAYPFWNSDNALQSTFGSLNYQRFVIKTKFRNTIPLKENTYVKLLGVHEEDLRADHFFFHPGYYKELGGSQVLGARHTLSKYKEDLDFSLYYRVGTEKSGIFEVEVAVLDWANNLVHSLITNSDRDYDAKQKYSRQPFLFSFQAESPEHPFLRAEISTGVQTESKARVVRFETPDSSFTNRERAHYLGGLIEFFRPNLTAGLTYQRRFTKMYRYPDAVSSEYPLDFGNREVMNRIGSYITKELWNRIHIEHWTWYEYNEDQLMGSSVPEGWQPFHYREDRLRMKSLLLYKRPNEGFQGGFELNLDHRYVLGERHGNTINIDFRRNYPDQVSGNNQRITLKIGYHRSNRIDIMAGVSYDIDGDLKSGWGTPSPNADGPSRFDGGFAQVTIRW